MATSRPGQKGESKDPAKGKITWSTPMEELIEAYLQEGDLMAALYMGWRQSKHFKQGDSQVDMKRQQDDRQVKEKWFVKLQEESKTWSEKTKELKEVKPLESNQTLRGQVLLWFLEPVADKGKVRNWVLQAANQGESVAQSIVGHYYSSGRFGFAKDSFAAKDFLKKSAEQGYCEGQAALGYLSFIADNDRVMAEHWYVLAAMQGHPMAQSNLADLKEKKGSMADAALWYRRSVMQRDSLAENPLYDLFNDNQKNLHVVFNAAVALRSRAIINRLNILLRQLVDKIEEEEKKSEVKEEKKEVAGEKPSSLKEFYALLEAAEDVPHSIIKEVVNDKKVISRWEQYVMKQVLIENRFSQITNPMTSLTINILSFVANMNQKEKAGVAEAASKHSKLPQARRGVAENLKDVLEGKEGADQALYKSYKDKLENFKAMSESKGHVIKDYSGLEKQIEVEAKKSGAASGKSVALGLLYYAAGDYRKAEQQFLQAKQAKDPRGYTYLAELYDNHRNYFNIQDYLAEQILQERDELIKSAAKARAKP